MSTKDPREVLAEWKANSDRIDVLRDEFEDKEIAGENYAVTIVPLDVLRAIEKSECAVPALVKAVEAVLAVCDNYREADDAGREWGEVPIVQIERAITDALTEEGR